MTETTPGTGTTTRPGTKTATRAVHRPALISSALSLAAATLAVALVAAGGAQFRALIVEVVGLLVFALGVELYHRDRDRSLAGIAIALAGASVVGFATLLGYSGTGVLADQMELLPGMVGLFLLVTGLVQIREGWARHLVTAGTGLVLVGVVGSGIVMGASATVLLAAVVATVVAWDVGEQAINLGEQLGRQAETHAVEIVHGAASMAVGGVGLALAIVIRNGNVTGVPLAGLALLLAAGVTLMLALYN